MNSTRAIEPVSLTTIDGEERKFLLTRGALNRLRKKLQAKNLPEILKKVGSDDDGAMGTFLYECLQDKGELTEEKFLEIMPFSIEHDQAAMAKILGVSLPEKKEDEDGRPTDPQTTIQ